MIGSLNANTDNLKLKLNQFAACTKTFVSGQLTKAMIDVGFSSGGLNNITGSGDGINRRGFVTTLTKTIAVGPFPLDVSLYLIGQANAIEASDGNNYDNFELYLDKNDGNSFARTVWIPPYENRLGTSSPDYPENVAGTITGRQTLNAGLTATYRLRVAFYRTGGDDTRVGGSILTIISQPNISTLLP